MQQQPTTCFEAARLTETVFAVVEYDRFDEHPFIYIKLYHEVVIVIDTGCGGRPKDPAEVTSLRVFLEQHPVEANSNKPLNSTGRPYVTVCTHCHYDHICGVEEFIGSHVIASGFDAKFIKEDLPSHSLCRYLDIPTPAYNPVLAPHLSTIHHKGRDLGLQVLHTPGHTPDSLAIWDESESMLYVGDTLYERAPIIFPIEGDLPQWFASMDYMIELVKTKSKEERQVWINCGHTTARKPALELLQATRAFLTDVVDNKIEPVERKVVRGFKVVIFMQEPKGRLSLVCPEKLLEDVRGQPTH